MLLSLCPSYLHVPSVIPNIETTLFCKLQTNAIGILHFAFQPDDKILSCTLSFLCYSLLTQAYLKIFSLLYVFFATLNILKSFVRYFTAPGTEIEKLDQDLLFNKILYQSVTVHFWNSLTSALIPESESLVFRLLNQYCIHCSDAL